MPLPTDEKILKLSNDLLRQFDTLFGLQPGFRPAHAKGVMLMGRFIPSREAASLSRAPHFNWESTPVTTRFSDSSGIPLIPDNDPNASPARGGNPISPCRPPAHGHHCSLDRWISDANRRGISTVVARDCSIRRPVHTASHTGGGVSRWSPEGAGVCSGAQAGAVELRSRKLFRHHGGALHQQGRYQPLRRAMHSSN